MNVERSSWLLPACGDRWLPFAVAEAFTVEHPLPGELQSILASLECDRRQGAPEPLFDSFETSSEPD
jgi:hypothetical protein